MAPRRCAPRSLRALGPMLAACLAVGALGCCPASSTSLHGQVANWTTGEPLAGVVVEATVLEVPEGVEKVSPEPVATGADGRFSFTGLPHAAELRLRVVGEEWITVPVEAETSTEAPSTELDVPILANPWPDLTVEVLDCLLGEPVRDVDVSIGGQTRATTGPDGKVLVERAGRPGTTILAVSAVGFEGTDVDVYLPRNPPFAKDVPLEICPLPPGTPDAGPVVFGVPGQPLYLAPIPPSSAVDEHAGQPYFGADEFAVNAAWYMLDDDAPVVPFEELDAAPSVGPRGRFLVRRDVLSKRGRDAPGALLGRVFRTGAAGEAGEATWKTDGMFRRPEVTTLARTGGIVGLGQLATPFYDETRVDVWTHWQKLADLLVEGVRVPEGYAMVQCPGEGLWAVVVAHGAKPWKIYPLQAPGPTP